MVRAAGWLLIFVVGGMCLFGSQQAEASEMDILVEKLVEKGILTREEAREIRQEVKEEVRREAQVRKAEVRKEVSRAVAKEEPRTVAERQLPAWIRNTKLFGDLKVRYEGKYRNYTVDQNRERIQLRLGLKSQPMESLEVGVRLATGGRGTPTSTNQTLTDTFDQKDFGVDRAYVKFTPWDWLSVTGGKMANPFVRTDIVWDSDVTPEGGALQLRYSGEGPIRPFANLAAFQIDELDGDAGDPALFGFQAGVDVEIPVSEGWIFTPSVAYYDFTGIAGRTASTITNAPSGNSLMDNGGIRDDFDVVNIIAQLKIPSSPFFGQPMKLLGDLVINTAADDDETAWQTGFVVGKVTEKFGSWKAFYYYKHFESDAAFGALSDGDFGGGGAGHKGHKLGARMGIGKNWDVGVTYFRVDDDEPTAGVERRTNTLQVETIVTF